jgi:hypothetical protein
VCNIETILNAVRTLSRAAIYIIMSYEKKKSYASLYMYHGSPDSICAYNAFGIDCVTVTGVHNHSKQLQHMVEAQSSLVTTS